MIYGPATIPHVVYYTFDANDCTVKEGCVPAGTRRLLAFDTQTRNMGQADFIMGNPATNSLFVFDPCHNHYHFVGFAEYRLRDTNSNLVVLGKKIGFCLEDIVQWDPNANTNRIYDCNYQGIQKGWADLYVEQVPCQWLDIRTPQRRLCRGDGDQPAAKHCGIGLQQQHHPGASFYPARLHDLSYAE